MDNIKEYILSNKKNSRELLNIIFKSQNPQTIRKTIINLGIEMKDFDLISMAQKIEYYECNKYVCMPLQFSDINLKKISDINYVYKLIDTIFTQNKEPTINIDIEIDDSYLVIIYKYIVSNIITRSNIITSGHNIPCRKNMYIFDYECKDLNIVKYMICKPFISDNIILANHLLETIKLYPQYKSYLDNIMNTYVCGAIRKFALANQQT